MLRPVAIESMRWSTWIPWVNTGEEPRLLPHVPDIRDGRPWPLPAQSIVRAWDDDGYAIDLELRLDKDDRPVVTGIAVRRAVPMEPRRDMKREPRWPEGTEPQPISPRDVKRLPLTQIAKAVATWVEATKDDPDSQERAEKMERVERTLFPPRGRSKGRVKKELYQWILFALQTLEKDLDPNPVQTIAARLGENPNKVHVWVHRAKEKRRRGEL
jgi:hypothetical protein